MKRGKFTYSAPKGAISRSAPVKPQGTKQAQFPISKPSSHEGPNWLHGVASSAVSSRSPRKRLRSPPPSEDLFQRPKSNGGSVAKDRKYEEEQEIDELDLLGTAALEQFELTQTERVEQRSSSQAAHIPETDTLPVSRSISSTKSIDLGGGLTSESERYSHERRSQKDLMAPTVGNSAAPTSVSKGATTTTIATTTTSSASVMELEEKMKQLQEKYFVNDGEVKVLRSEKEKYVAELRKKDEQINHLQHQMAAEKKSSEKIASKERDSFLTRLQFKEQEVRALQEKCAELEQRQKQVSGFSSSSTPQHRLPAKSQPVKTNLSSVKRMRGGAGGEGGVASRTPSPSKPMEFLSSETFMPLSQLNSSSAGVVFNSIPVTSSRTNAGKEERQVMRRGSADSFQDNGGRDGARKSRRGSSKVGSNGNRSRSISPSPSDTKKMKRKSLSDKDNYGGSTEDLDGLYGVEMASEGSKEPKSVPSSQGSIPQTSSSKPKDCNGAMFRLSVPSREIDGSQLILLLSNHDLLKPPVAPTTAAVAAAATTVDASSLPGSNSNQHAVAAMDKPVARGSSTSSTTHQQFPAASLVQGEIVPPPAMTGLLSLLSLDAKQQQQQQQQLPKHHHSPVHHSTPAKRIQFIHSSPASLSRSSSSSLKTPSRKSRLLPLQKSYTIGRANQAQGRVRHNSGLLVSTKMMSMSASNTPAKTSTLANSFGSVQSSDLPLSHSLIRSISTISVHSSISSLLASSEVLRFSSSIPAPVVKQRRGAKEGRQHLEILREMSNFIVSYHREQVLKLQSLQTSSSGGDGSSDSLDTTFLPSGRSPNRISSLEWSSSLSSMSSASLVGVAPVPMSGSQQYLSQALGTVEILVTYSKTAREHLLTEPMEFALDSRGTSFSLSSSSGGHLNSPALAGGSLGSKGASTSTDGEDNNNKMETEEVGGARGVGGVVKEHSVVSKLAKVAHRLVALQDSGAEQQEVPDSVEQERIVRCKNFSRLVHLPRLLGSTLSGSMWGTYEDSVSSLSANSSSRLLPQCGRDSESIVVGSGCGKVFSVLLELLYCPWVESRDNVVLCVNVLVELAKDCSEASFTRFVPLFQKDTLVLCLEREDHALSSAILSLLTLLIRSQTILANLCNTAGGDSCVLTTLYQFLLEPPTSWSPGGGGVAASGVGDLAGSDEGSRGEDFSIPSKITRLLSRILVSPSGPEVLFEKCNCSHVYLRALVCFLERMVDNISQLSQWTQKQLTLVLEIISLVYKVSFNDRFFDSHRDSCEHTYSYVFNRLGVLLLELPQDCRELSMVNELLVYCEEYDDSPRESSQEDSDKNST